MINIFQKDPSYNKILEKIKQKIINELDKGEHLGIIQNFEIEVHVIQQFNVN